MKRILLTLLLTAALTASAQVSPWAFGLQAGVAAYTTTGSLHDNFKGAVGFTGGITAQWHQARLKADVTYSQPSFRNPNMFDVHDEQGHEAEVNAKSNASTVALSLQYGYTIFQFGAVSITPCAGIHYSRYAWDINSIEWSKDEQDEDIFKITGTHHATCGSLQPIASIDFDFKLHEKYTDAFGPQQRLRSSIRVTPYITYARHKKVSPKVGGCIVGVTLTYSGLLRNM